jgi:hypothetical protein
MTDRNVGKFKLDEALIRNEPELVADIMALLRIVVIRAEALFAEREIRYVALSPAFKLLAPGMKVLEYRLEITKKEDGTLESARLY